MPSIKMKTHKGIKKRFKVTATGKIMHKPCGSSHLNSHKSGKKIRRLRRSKVLNNPAVTRTLRIALVQEVNLEPRDVEVIVERIPAEAGS